MSSDEPKVMSSVQFEACMAQIQTPPSMAIQAICQEELSQYGDLVTTEIAMWMNNPRLAKLHVTGIPDKERAIVKQACTLYKEFRQKLAELGDQMYCE